MLMLNYGGDHATEMRAVKVRYAQCGIGIFGRSRKGVQMLMDAGADVNAQDGLSSNALQAASSGGHENVVQMLMDAGADVNTQGGYYGNALQAALSEGHEKVIQLFSFPCLPGRSS
jgi:hypothetical protein